MGLSKRLTGQRVATPAPSRHKRRRRTRIGLGRTRAQAPIVCKKCMFREVGSDSSDRIGLVRPSPILQKVYFFYKQLLPIIGLNPLGTLKFLKVRSDDTKSIVVRRYDNYIKQTSPLIEFYKNKKKLYSIDGKMGIYEIFAQIRRIIKL